MQVEPWYLDWPLRRPEGCFRPRPLPGVHRMEVASGQPLRGERIQGLKGSNPRFIPFLLVGRHQSYSDHLASANLTPKGKEIKAMASLLRPASSQHA